MTTAAGGSSFSFDTQAVHGGIAPDPATRAVVPSIVPSCMFDADWGDIGFSAEGTDPERAEFVYAREGHPNAAQLERRLALLDDADDAIVFSSGIAAISGLFLHLLGPGDHAVVSDVSYAGTAELVRGILRDKRIEITFADMSDPLDVKESIRGNTRLIYAESPCNPVLKIVDIAAIADIAHAAGARFALDSTFATPALQKPLKHGADFALYSLTKYYGGHGDAMGGAIVGEREEIARIRHQVGVHLGAALSPFNCWLINRGIETLPIRMARHAESAGIVAAFLEEHPVVTSVRYPGLPSHPQFELAGRQMSGPAGMISFTVRDFQAFGNAMAGNMRLFKYAASLGSTRSLILFCDTTDLQRTTFQLDDKHLDRYREWCGDGFFRLSIGLEDPLDLCGDLERVLAASA